MRCYVNKETGAIVKVASELSGIWEPCDDNLITPEEEVAPDPEEKPKKKGARRKNTKEDAEE